MDPAEIDARFIAVNRNLGLGPDDFTAGAQSHIVAAPDTTEVVLDNSGDCALKGMVIKTESLEQLRNMVLADDGPNAQDIHVLSEFYKGVDAQFIKKLNAGEDIGGSGTADKAELIKLASLFVFGYEAIPAPTLVAANKRLFPSRATIYTGGELFIEANTSLVLEGSDPIILNFKTITLAASAKIEVFSKASLFFGSVLVLPKGPEDERICEETIHVVARPWDPAKAQTGAKGSTPEMAPSGTAGENTYDKEDNIYTCTVAPENGDPGLAGGEGEKGINGMPARDTEPANVDILETQGAVSVVCEGGSGQGGGAGGDGGDGGAGGFGGYVPSGCHPAKSGIAGQGGLGGPGGDGGNASVIREPIRVVKRSESLVVEARAGRGGAGGVAGSPGLSPDGNGSLGAQGRGIDGRDGPIPMVFTVRN